MLETKASKTIRKRSDKTRRVFKGPINWIKNHCIIIKWLRKMDENLNEYWESRGW